MAQIRSTRYVCDICKKDVERKRDLTRYHVRRGNDWSMEVTFDTCEPCGVGFTDTIVGFVGEGAADWQVKA